MLSPRAQRDLVDLIDRRIAEHLAASSHAQSSPWVTVDEAAEILRTTPAAVYKRINRRQISAHRLEGSRILILRDDLLPTGPSA